jgi:hypothetical protein
MFRLLSVVGLLLVSVFSSLAMADAPNERGRTPRKQIWAFDMPGALDVRELESDTRKAGQSAPLTSGILQALSKNKPGQKAQAAFAVLGAGAEALKQAHAVLADGKKPRASFPADSKVSVVFFSYSFSYYVHLRKIEQEPGKVVITYRFGPHRTKEMTSHFALIPLDKQPPGEVKVEFVRAPIDPQLKVGWFKEPPPTTDAQIVSQPFSFTVEK